MHIHTYSAVVVLEIYKLDLQIHGAGLKALGILKIIYYEEK